MAETEKPKKKSISVSHDEVDPKPASKEIKVTSRPILKKDPEPENDTKAELPKPTKSMAGQGPTIQPLDQASAKPAPEEEPEIEPRAEAEKSAEAATPETNEETKKAEPAATKVAEPKPTEDEPAATDSIPDEASEKGEASAEPTKQEQLEAAKQLEHAAEIDKLAESRKFALPINSVEKRRTKRSLIIGIIISLVLILAWLNIALDAGLININGIEPLTHFF